MWCPKCHCGSENTRWKLDEKDQIKCPQCGNFVVVLNRNPFLQNKSLGRTLGGRKQDLPAPKKFQFDQKDGKDTENPVT